MYKFGIIDKVSLVLIIIGAFNWGLIGLFNFNIVGSIFGEPANFIGRLIYILIGIAGIDMLLLIYKMRKVSRS
jgi:uncharacterized protein